MRRFAVVLTSLPLLPPQSRADCIDGPRPCPWNTCRNHLERGQDFPYCDSTREGGDTCALDIADRGGMSLAKLSELLGENHETIRQIEITALSKLKESVCSSQADM